MVLLKSRQKNNSRGSSVGYSYGVKIFNQIKSGCSHWLKLLKARNLNFNEKFNRLAVQRKNKFYYRQNHNGFKNYICEYRQDSMRHLAEN